MLSLIDKASKLNRLMKLKNPSTPCEGKTNIQKMLESYSSSTNMTIDSMIWKVYGLHYKEYVDTRLANCGICTYDIIKIEQAIDNSIAFLEQELS